MAGSSSFSLGEKLAVAGAFCAIVALAVGTENDPGVIVKTAETLPSLGSARTVPASRNWWQSDGATPASAPLAPRPGLPAKPNRDAEFPT